MEPRNQIQTHLERNYNFTCRCKRCSSSDDLNSNFSHLECNCGGFFSSRGKKTGDDLCSKCGVGDNKLSEKVSELRQRLDKEGWSAEVEEEVEAIPGCHANHHLRIQLYIAFLEERHQDKRKVEEDAEKVVERASSVLQVLNKLDPGCTKLAGKYLNMVVTGQMASARAKGGLSGMSREMVVMSREMARARMQAVKLSSDFCVVGK